MTAYKMGPSMIKTALRRGAEADVGVPYVKPDQRGDAGACVQKAAQLAGYGIVRDGVCTGRRPTHP